MTGHQFFGTDSIYIINLPERRDRLSEMVAQLERVGAGLSDSQVTRFPAHRPSSEGGFPTIGARGCFLSHLDVLRDARERDFGQILVLEDDADFTRPFVSSGTELLQRLRDRGANIAYLGYRAMGPLESIDDQDLRRVPPRTELQLTHAVMFDRASIAALIPYLEAILGRPPGDPLGGPMHVDGAYSRFRADHPHYRTLAPRKPWIVQRSSRTDVHAPRWRDKIPLIATARRARNRLRQMTQRSPSE